MDREGLAQSWFTSLSPEIPAGPDHRAYIRGMDKHVLASEAKQEAERATFVCCSIYRASG